MEGSTRMRGMMVAAGAAVMAALMVTPGIAHAAPAGAITVATAQAAPRPAPATGEGALGLLATPAEMRMMGATETQVQHQAAGVALLSAERRAEQDRIRTEQARTAQALSAASPETASTEAAGQGAGQTRAHLMPCLAGNDYYMVTWNLGSSKDCLANAGTWDASPVLIHTKSVRPGNNVGRVYYPWGEYWYWSPWRGKTMSTYTFDSPVNAYKIQIQ